MTDTPEPPDTGQGVGGQGVGGQGVGGQGVGGRPPPGPIRDLPLWQVLERGYRLVFIERLAVLPRAALLPGLLWLAIGVFDLGAAEPPSVPDGEQPKYQVYNVSWIGLAASLVAYTWFAVSWHRLVLMGPAQGAPPVLPAWRARHWRFLGYVLLLVLGVLILFGAAFLAFAMFNLLAPSGIGGLGFANILLIIGGGFGGSLAIAYVMARFSFVFPAVAVDEAYGLSDSWGHTKRQGWRLLVVFVVGALPFIVVSQVLTSLIPTSFGVSVLGMIPYMILDFLSLAVGVSLVSLSFTACTGWIPREPPSSTQT